MSEFTDCRSSFAPWSSINLCWNSFAHGGIIGGHIFEHELRFAPGVHEEELMCAKTKPNNISQRLFLLLSV